MARHRDYIEEILAKKDRHLRRVDRHEQFRRRVIPLVKGYRYLLSHSSDVDFRNEWIKYGAIGYIACVEGYFRILFADLINSGNPYAKNITAFKDIKITIDDVLALHSRTVSLGEYVAHLLPINGIPDIDNNLSTLLGRDFLSAYRAQPASDWVQTPIGDLFPETISEVQALFQLRHLYCHELAPKALVKPRKLTSLIGSAAAFVWHTEEMIQQKILVST